MDTTTHVIRIVDVRQNAVVRAAKGMTFMAVILAVCMGPGLLFDSDAMQWAGFVLVQVFAVMMLSQVGRNDMTIEEAQTYLAKLKEPN